MIITLTPEEARNILTENSKDRLARLILDQLLPVENTLLEAFLAFMDAYPKHYDGSDYVTVKRLLTEFHYIHPHNFVNVPSFNAFADNFLTKNWKIITQQQL